MVDCAQKSDSDVAKNTTPKKNTKVNSDPYIWLTVRRNMTPMLPRIRQKKYKIFQNVKAWDPANKSKSNHCQCSV